MRSVLSVSCQQPVLCSVLPYLLCGLSLADLCGVGVVCGFPAGYEEKM